MVPLYQGEIKELYVSDNENKIAISELPLKSGWCRSEVLFHKENYSSSACSKFCSGRESFVQIGAQEKGQMISGGIMGGKMSLELSQSLDLLWQLPNWQNIDVSDATLLNGLSTHIKDFPSTGTFQLEAWQAVGQKLASIANACKHLTTWGTVIATLKETHK